MGRLISPPRAHTLIGDSSCCGVALCYRTTATICLATSLRRSRFHPKLATPIPRTQIICSYFVLFEQRRLTKGFCAAKVQLDSVECRVRLGRPQRAHLPTEAHSTQKTNNNQATVAGCYHPVRGHRSAWQVVDLCISIRDLYALRGLMMKNYTAGCDIEEITIIILGQLYK